MDKFRRFCKRHFNELGIYGGTEITRLIGYSEDADDCYYILLAPPEEYKGKCKEIHASMVGGWYSIKKMGKAGYEYTQRNCHIPNALKYKEILTTESPLENFLGSQPVVHDGEDFPNG
jgi:hypothetical protein